MTSLYKRGRFYASAIFRADPRWFKRAFVYTGSIGDFRYRFAMDKDAGVLHTAVYTVYCFEAANDVQQQDFPWDDQGWSS